MKLARLIAKDPKLARDMYADNNKIEEILFISYTLKILKLVVIICNISYLLAIFWLIGCESYQDFILGMEKQTEEYADEHPDTFIHYNGFHGQSAELNVIICVYFAFTSLSTVGFGDYHPRSNVERLTCAFILLFGVAIFSYIMGNFISVIEQFKAFHQDLEDGDQLSKFFGTIKKFNNNVQIDLELKQRIEAFFEYKWRMDKNMAFLEEQDKNIFD